jgi:hypothetical protein
VLCIDEVKEVRSFGVVPSLTQHFHLALVTGCGGRFPMLGPMVLHNDPDIGCDPISGHRDTILVIKYPISGPISGSILGIQIPACTEYRYQAQYRVQYRVSLYHHVQTADIGFNVGLNKALYYKGIPKSGSYDPYINDIISNIGYDIGCP